MNLITARRKEIKKEDAIIVCRFLKEFEKYNQILNSNLFSLLSKEQQEVYALRFKDSYLKYSIGLTEFLKKYFGKTDAFIGKFIFDLQNNYILYEYEE